MRKDITLNTQTGELVLKNKEMVPEGVFQWNTEDDLFLYGQVNIKENIDIANNIGVLVEIPYTPIYKKVKISIMRDYGTYTVPVLNQVNGSVWFDVKCILYNKKTITPYASEFVLINDLKYKINIKDNQVYIWSFNNSDFQISDANNQNKNLMLKCVPSNNYRYPVSGVGVIRYLHANINQTDMANRLYTEFKDDKVIVNTASFNTNTGQLELDLDYSEANENI